MPANIYSGEALAAEGIDDMSGNILGIEAEYNALDAKKLLYVASVVHDCGWGGGDENDGGVFPNKQKGTYVGALILVVFQLLYLVS